MEDKRAAHSLSVYMVAYIAITQLEKTELRQLKGCVVKKKENEVRGRRKNDC